MNYTIDFKNNKILFKNSYSKGVITIEDSQAEINLIKVEQGFRGLGYAKKLMSTLLQFIKNKFNHIKKIFLSPLPLDNQGLTLKELVYFYSKFDFKPSPIPPQSAPYMMERYF